MLYSIVYDTMEKNTMKLSRNQLKLWLLRFLPALLILAKALSSSADGGSGGEVIDPWG